MPLFASTHWIEIDFIAVSALLGFILPLIVNFLKDNQVLTHLGLPEVWTGRLKVWFTAITAFVAAVVVWAAENGFSGIGWTEVNSLLVSFPIIWIAATSFYNNFWKGSEWGEKLREAGRTVRPPLPSQGDPDFGDDEEGDLFG